MIVKFFKSLQTSGNSSKSETSRGKRKHFKSFEEQKRSKSRPPDTLVSIGRPHAGGTWCYFLRTINVFVCYSSFYVVSVNYGAFMGIVLLKPVLSKNTVLC